MDISAVVTLIIVGLIAGALAKIAMPGPDPGGILLTIVIGIAGSFVGWVVVYNLLGIANPDSTGLLGSILVATLGSVILLVLYRAITRRSA